MKKGGDALVGMIGDRRLVKIKRYWGDRGMGKEGSWERGKLGR
jgi:hypothetical protein